MKNIVPFYSRNEIREAEKDLVKVYSENELKIQLKQDPKRKTKKVDNRNKKYNEDLKGKNPKTYA